MANSSFTAEHRRKLLASARKYFTYCEKFVTCCPYLAVGQPDSYPQFQEKIGKWDGNLKFKTGHVLRFRDIYDLDESGILTRTINFDFRMEHEAKEIFRLDAHGAPISGDEACHLEIGDGKRYEAGDPMLKGFSLSDITLCDVILLIDTHLKGEALPWE